MHMIVRKPILLICAAALSACGGPSSLSSPGAIPQSRAVTPLARPASTPTPFTFQTVDDPASKVNSVAGINAGGEIVGNIGSGSKSDPLQGYISATPYSSFTPLVYPNSGGTIATSISNVPSHLIVVGNVINPPQLSVVWGFVNINGLWTLFKDHHEGTGKNAVTELLGVNDSEFAVGFFTNSLGNNVPIVLNIPAIKWIVLKPPGYTSAEATGINAVNDMEGWEKTKSGTNGFLWRAGAYYTFSYPGASATYAQGINSFDQIVGYYTDASGLKHGFIMSNPTGQPAWQSIDDANGAKGTVVSGVNDSDDICGYYVDGNGVQHGFVAVP
jgi:hypothetical protein